MDIPQSIRNIYVYYSCKLCWLHLLIETVLSFCSAPCKTTGVVLHMTHCSETWNIYQYTCIHILYKCTYIYIIIYIIISIYPCVNVYTSIYTHLQAVSLLFRVCFFPLFYCQAAVSPQTFSLLPPESPPHDVLAPQHERPVGPCRDGQDLPVLLGVFGEATLLVAAYFWFELWILQQLQIHSFQVKTRVIFEGFAIYARSKHILDTSNKKKS